MGRTYPRKTSSGRCCHCSAPRRSFPKSKITAERLTLLPGFLHKGASGTSGSSPEHDSPPAVRRSWRLVNSQPHSVSSYFDRLEAGKTDFKKIKKKLQVVEEDWDFERRLVRAVGHVKDTHLHRKIAEEIEGINSVLLRRSSRSMSMNRKRAFDEEEKENFPIKFSYVPPSSWVFQTPPNRKLNYNNVRVEDNALKPVVIENRDEKKIIYQMNKKINVDLSNFNSKDEVSIDKRYMVEVSEDDSEEKMDFLQNETFELENHFLSLTSRPKKVAPTFHRVNPTKRKRDIFEPQPGCSTDSDDYKPNVCLLDSLQISNMEESFTFKFTGDEGGTTGHLFDYEGNKKNSFNFRF